MRSTLISNHGRMNGVPMSQTEALSPEKQRQILRGAAEVFAEDGYEGASMSRIAACAGVSKGTLYNYFDSKADMFAAWVHLECDHMLHDVFDGHDPYGDPEVVLRDLGLRCVRMMVSTTGRTMYRVAISEAKKFPEVARAFYDAGPACGIARVADWLRLQTAAGRLQITDPVFAAEQFFALCQTQLVLRRRLELQSDPTEDAIAAIVDASIAMFLSLYGERP